jgi:hypothetical protein
MAHMKQITDICELASPRVVASASLDGQIKVNPTLFRYHCNNKIMIYFLKNLFCFNKLWDISDPNAATLKTELRDPSQSQ